MSGKRKREVDKEVDEGNEEKPVCKYGMDCYRRNPLHLQAYSHPEEGESSHGNKRLKATNDAKEQSNAVNETTEVNETNIVPFLLTKVRGIPAQFNKKSLAIGLRDILSSKMGDLQESVQFNYMFDIAWLLDHYPPDKRSKPLLLIHGDQNEKKKQLEKEAEPFPNVKLFQARLPITFGTHHSKMMLLRYAEGMRVVVTTANLIQADWDKKTQGAWISPLFPKHSVTGQNAKKKSQFQTDLLDYLKQYGSGPLNEWREHIMEHDMSEAKVHLIASVPGRHIGCDKDKWGHLKLRKIFPTVENVRTSLEGYNAGGSLPYSWKTAAKQPYLKDFFCHWQSDHMGRSRASPHLKSYTRISSDGKKAAWFVVTSANLSKAAWGALEKNHSQLMIRSYEIGVLFLPQDLDSSQEYFNLDIASDGPSVLRLPYDFPLKPYASNDIPWMWDRQYKKPDVFGNTWSP